MELLNALGFDWKIFLAQLFNFAVLVFVLYRFGYKPIIEFLDERKKNIEKGLKNTEESNKKLEEVSKIEKEILEKARDEAKEIINLAKDTAQKSRLQIIKKAEDESGAILEKVKLEIKEEKAKVMREVKTQAVELVILATEKMIKEKIDSEKDKMIIKKSIGN